MLEKFVVMYKIGNKDVPLQSTVDFAVKSVQS